MSKVICENDDLVNIANAVRSQTGTTEPMTLGEMASNIMTLNSGGSGGAAYSWNDLLDRPFYTEENAEVDVLPAQDCFFSSAGNGLYSWVSQGCMLVNGSTYNVVWGEDEFTCTATEATLGESTGIALGNLAIIGLSGGDDVPFVFGYDPTGGGILCYTTDPTETRNVRIYQGGEVVHTLDEKYLPKEAIVAMIDAYIEETLGGDY